MDRFFLPLPVVPRYGSDSLYIHAIQELEQCLDVALCLLRKTAERLRTALGSEALGPELSRFLAGNDPIAQSMVVSHIDSIVKQKNEPEGVRLIRELFDVTWDQAFELYSCWLRWDHGRKLRCLQIVELRKLFASFNDSSREKPAHDDYRESIANRGESA
jgi:hypothetical protein